MNLWLPDMSNNKAQLGPRTRNSLIMVLRRGKADVEAEISIAVGKCLKTISGTQTIK